MAGLTSHHKRGHLYRSMLEGIALEQAMITGEIEEATSPIDHLRGDRWRCCFEALVSDPRRLQRKTVLRSDTVEASSLGAGIAAAAGAGWFGSIPRRRRR